jgi:hypothetical protein
MAILPVTAEDVEAISTVINPVRNYHSSSLGVTGSINLFPRNSPIEKEISPLENFAASYASDDDLEALREDIAFAAATINSTSIFSSLNQYLSAVNKQTISAKKRKQIFINRFTPSVSFTSNTLRKLIVKDQLMSYYRTLYPTSDWAYTNYHSLNFFTSSTVPTSSVLIYPNGSEAEGGAGGAYSLQSTAYYRNMLGKGFSFDFYINPRYRPDNPDAQFKAGTIFHLSSSYAISLITGSKKGPDGLPEAFRLQLQLSQSADISPSVATPGSYPQNLVFLSEDNSLEWNKWHRVVIRWGSSAVNKGSGSFNINGIDKGTFVIPSSSIGRFYSYLQSYPAALYVGNYYEGTNQGTSDQRYWFTDRSSKRDGLVQLINSLDTVDEPAQYAFNHPLNAELHELIIRDHYMTNAEIGQTYGKGVTFPVTSSIVFYAPPMFVETTPIRKFVGSYGGILQTPFFEVDGSTDDPFNVAMSFGVAGHYINLENFVKDFANGRWPRLHHLSASAISYTTEARSANDFLYDNPMVRKRNLTILPCDDVFVPNYSILSNESKTNKFVDQFGNYDPSLINLDNLLNAASLLVGSKWDADKYPDIVEDLIGCTPENPGMIPGQALQNIVNQINTQIATQESSYGPGVQKNVPLAIFQRTKDPSSNQVTFFDISNLYYGNNIVPGTFMIKDTNLSGSGGKVKITLKDDGVGNIYRADSFSPNSDWNSVGNIFYNEGIIVIKSPHLYFFGKEQYEISFRGEHKLHSMKFDILAPSALLNSSSNTSYAPIKETIRASGDPIDNDVFVYISSMNLHDENLNVVAKAVLAQPVIKREGEKLLFKVAFDF